MRRLGNNQWSRSPDAPVGAAKSNSAENTAIFYATVVAFAEVLGSSVTAETVGKDEQLAWLEDVGCESGPGYHFARVIPSETAVPLLYP